MRQRDLPGRKHAILLTGPPGIGKTTALRRAADALTGWSIRGFTTDEIRSAGQRVGFRLETYDGREIILAGVDLTSRTDDEAAAFADFCARAAPGLYLSTVVAAELRAGAGSAKDRRTLERQVLSPYRRRGEC